MTVTVGSLCTGYGGLETGLALADPDVVPVWHAEIDPDASAVLAAALPGVPNLGDIIGRDWLAIPRPDILTAGFPCQPVSAAGRQLADADPRWLWPAVRGAVAALRPPVVFLENVRNITSIKRGEIHALILSDLRALGYACRWVILGACAVGAAHHRHRWFLRADRAPDNSHVPPAVRLDAPACGAPRGKTLPTPTARDGDGRGEGDARYWDARSATRANGLPLGAAVALLPTPTATGFGAFAPAVRRHAEAFGAEPPDPTEANGNGSPRLSAAFAEWMMGLPAGHVTTHVPRTVALRILGNGAVPAQVAAAWRLLQPTQSMEEAMSDTTQDLRGTASHPSGDDYKGPVAEPTESYDSEIALNGSRDLLRAGSTVFAGIRKAIEFHAVADGGAGTQAHSPAQVVREVLGTIERAATEASKHQPKWRKSNGMPEFAEFNPAALRQLAALCRVYAGIDPVTPAETVELESGTAPEWVDAHAAVAASIAAHERDVITERPDLEPTRPLAADEVEDVSRIEHPAREPDPFDDPAPLPAPVDTWPANIITNLPGGATLITGPPDPFSNPAPVGHAPDGTDDGIPF